MIDTTATKRVMREPVKLTGKEELPPGKRDDIRSDRDMPGLWLRLRAGSNGRTIRSWVIVYRVAGRSKRYLLGNAAHLTAPQARELARKKLAEVVLGNDPQATKAKERQVGTLREVIGLYIDARTPSWRENTRLLQTRLLTSSPFKPLHSIKVDRLTRADVASCTLTITKESGSPTALLARSALSSCLSWAVSQGLCEANAVIGSTVPERGRSRDRVLTNSELRAIWLACEGLGEYAAVVRLMILCAGRRQEIGGLRWDEIDRDAGTITISAARSKNHRALTLPLPALAWSILDNVPRVDDRGCLFGVRGSSGFSMWAWAKRRLDARLGGAVAPFELRDLRRSTATHMADLGVQPHVIEQVLNHQSGHKAGTAGTYNRSSYEREVRAAMALWADHLIAMVEGDERKVVPLQRVP